MFGTFTCRDCPVWQRLTGRCQFWRAGTKRIVCLVHERCTRQTIPFFHYTYRWFVVQEPSCILCCQKCWYFIAENISCFVTFIDYSIFYRWRFITFWNHIGLRYCNWFPKFVTLLSILITNIETPQKETSHDTELISFFRASSNVLIPNTERHFESRLQ